MAALSSVVRLLRDLVAIPSVNPAFLTAGDPRAGEAAVGGFVMATAATAGLDVEVQEVVAGRSNVVVRLAPTGRVRQRLLLAPHLDTVGEPNLSKLLDPAIRGGRLMGRGACDTKGCVAAMLEAVRRVAASGKRPETTEIVFVGLVDEENGQLGSRHYAAWSKGRGRSRFGADLAIVGEPTRLEVVTAHKGDVWLQLRTEGRAAHGATPQLGRNAVHEMARVVEVLEVEYREQLNARSHPLLGSPTINVGSIRGGTQPNIVPDECMIAIDRRTLPGEGEAQVRREIRTLLKARGLKVVFDVLRAAPCHALETDPGLPWVQALCRAAGRKETRGVHYFCDAAPLAEGGIPSVVFGPGDIAQAHTRDEWIAVESLEQGARQLEEFLRGLE
jgi:acetylornithine deacetylase/succinyl-diaminopimelate desuccinylase-like protein